MSKSFLRKSLAGFRPYVPGEQPPDGEGWVKLNTNESPLPPSPNVIAAIKAATLDAQENPFANTVTYGVHKFHHFHSVTNHFYISRPIFLHRAAFDGWQI